MVLLAVLAGMAVLALVGAAALSLLPDAARHRLFPASPVIGAAVSVVFLHATALFTGARLGMAVLILLSVAILGVQLVWRRAIFASMASSAPTLGLLTIIGMAAATLVALPQLLAVDAFLVQWGDSYDAFYYVSGSSWLTDHSLLSVPAAAAVPTDGVPAPVFGPAMTSITTGLRVGQELLEAGITSVLGLGAAPGFPVVVGLWVAVAPGAVWAFGDVFGIVPRLRAGLVVVFVISASLVTQVLDAKAASVLGVALAALAVALVAGSVRPFAGYPRVPPLLAAIGVAAIVGTYTEYTPFIGPVLVCIVLVGPLAGTRTAVIRASIVLLLALLVSPIVWWRAWSSLSLTAQVVGSGGNAESTAGRISGLLGPLRAPVVSWRDGPGQLLFASLVAAAVFFVAAGLVVGVAFIATRGLCVGVLLASVVAVAIAARGNDYVTSRASAMLLPLTLLGAMAGWAGLWSHVRSGRGRAAASAVVAVVLLVLFAVNAQESSVAVFRPVPRQFVAGDDMRQASAWVHSIADSSGEDVSVATAQLFDQLWLSDLLADRPLTSYLSLRGDLGYRGVVQKQSYWDGEATRFVLAGPGAFTAGDEGVIRSNDRYRFVDLSSNPEAAVVVPVQTAGRLAWQIGPHGEISGVVSNQLVVMTGRSPAPLVVRFAQARPGAVVTAEQDGRVVASARADETGNVRLRLEGADTTEGACILDLGSGGGESLALTGISRSSR